MLTQISDTKICPFTKQNEDLWKNSRSIVDGTSIVFTRKAVVNENFIRKSAHFCKSIVVIDASPRYPHLISQPTPAGLYTIRVGISIQRRVDLRLDKTRPAALKIWPCPIFQRARPECEIESFFTTGRQKKSDCFSVSGFCSHCNIVFEAVGCFYHFCPCKEMQPSLTEKDIQRACKKRELDALRLHCIPQKVFRVVEMWECEWWRLYKTTNTVKHYIREHFH